jgi:Domain of unknown function (DUF4198)
MTSVSRIRTLGFVLGIAVLAAGPAAAHEYWLQPSRYAAAAGDTILVGAHVGTGFRGDAVPYAATRSVHFVLQGPHRIDLSRAPINGDLTWARLVSADGGGALIGYESNFAFLQLDGATFDAYLATEGLDAARGERAKRGEHGAARERYARCPKTWVSGSDPTRSKQPLGLTLEIVPLATPGVDGTLSVRLLYRGKPLAGALVRAWREPLGPTLVPADPAARDSVGPCRSARTANDGTATLSVAAPGEWLISATHMVRCPDREVADWESYWASLTFARLAR